LPSIGNALKSPTAAAHARDLCEQEIVMKNNDRLAGLDQGANLIRKCFRDAAGRKSMLIKLGRTLNLSLTTFIQTMLAPYGLNEGELYTLGLIHALDDGDATPGVLRAYLGNSPAIMTRILGSLENNGYIERRQDNQDGRMTRVFLTTRGRTTVVETIPITTRTLNKALSGLSDKELAQLEALLRKAICSIDNAVSNIDAARRQSQN
jgi:DNA-binding MarR family transcriptional regulator